MVYANQYGVSTETKQQIEAYYTGLNTSLAQFEDIFKVDAMTSQSDDFKEKTLKSIQLEIAEWKRKKRWIK